MANEKSGESLRVKTNDGKYTYIMLDDGRIFALRYEKPWIDSMTNIAGTGMTLALASDLDEARREISDLRNKIEEKEPS